jgi:hypothetical protein
MNNNISNNAQNFNQPTPDNNNIPSNGMNFNQPLPNNINSNNQNVKKSKNTIIIALAIIGGFIVVIIILLVAIISIVSSNSNKLVCKSNEGNITIMYDDSTINGYVATGITYDFDQQKEVANQLGIDSYISQFTTWFETNTTGTCTIEEK